ncbi:BnaUnng00240D [Brassica napus]|uniref:GDSL esterase/lipase n=2 Tax=Brassica TaxID=3705 RepID=A0A3P6CPU3_BRAOL|nr:unnamed protein product [Brassica napus]CDY27674.1 BnaUnng00240D [Brassica napus]VDD12171.1 unnamed protein product [Brassica oleracea]
MPFARAFNLIPTGKCFDQSKFVFWDAYHPTEATKALLDGDQTVATPLNIRYLNHL